MCIFVGGRVLRLIATYCDYTCGLRSFAMLNAKYAKSPMLSGKQSPSDSQQWVFTLTIVGLPLAYTQAECRSTEAANSFFFFSPQLHPRTLHQSPVMAAPRFLSARVYTPAHTRSRRSIYMYIEFIPYREFILRIPSRSFLPEGRLS